MGKVGAATPAQPKAKAEPAAAKAGAKEADSKKASTKESNPETAAKLKLIEEASQALQDDERAEKNRIEMRDQNRQITANGAQLKGNRDKSLARVTKFQNKLKLFKGESEFSAVEKDIDGVDGSKYVSELADSLMEAAGVSLKLKEMPAGVKVCTRLRATYGEFSTALADAIKKAFDSCPNTDLNRRRFLLRFCVELVLVECIPASSNVLLNMVKDLTDGSLPEDVLVVNFTILSSLAQKHAMSCLNTLPNKQAVYEEALGRRWCERTVMLDEELRTQILHLVINMYQNCAAGLLQSAHGRLLEQEKTNTKLRVDKGQVDAENMQKHDQFKEAYSKLLAVLTTLSEYLNQEIPKAQEEEPTASRLVGKRETNIEQEEELPMIWEDTEQQKFYEEILDPKDVIPAVLLQTGKKEVEKTEDAKEEEVEVKTHEELKAEREERKAELASDFELYLARVSKAESAKQVDDVVIEFFHEWNTKGNRRALATTLFKVHRTKLHMLAPHSRLIAIVAPYMKDVPNYVLTGLNKELEYIKKEKDPVLIESKIRTVLYLCELCKFKVCPPGVILDMYKEFLDDFTQHHAELCAHILQCCGRFLLYTPETTTRTDNLLERMARLKNAKSLGLRLEIMLEDAYYQVKPPENKKKQQKEKPPLELFVEHLIFEMLYKEEDDEKVLKLIRKLPWQDNVTPGYLKKAVLDLNMHANYETLYVTAELLSSLARYRDAFVIEVLDNLFEQIQATIERNDFREMPIRVRQIKLVGELYNYKLVDSGVIFDTLYMLIGFSGPSSYKAGQQQTAHRVLERCMSVRKGNLGAITEEAEEAANTATGMQLPAIFADPQHPLEAPWDYFRIKLVCVLLETCGHYFGMNKGKLKMDRFLHFFSRYVHSKGELPLRFMNMVYDTLERLRPRYVFPKTKADADAAVIKLMQAERSHLDLDEDKGDGENEADEEEDDEEEEDESSEDESSEDEEEEESEEESEEEDEEEDEEEEAEDYNRQGAGEHQKTQHEQEMEDFDKEVQQMLIDALEREKHAPRNNVDLPESLTTIKKPEAATQGGGFTLIQKRTGKMTTKAISVPEDSKLAMISRSHNAQADQEHQDLKKFILQLDDHDSNVPGAHSPFKVHVRQGKGAGKSAAQAAAARARKHEYLKPDMLPSDEPDFVPGPGMTIRFSGGMGKGAGGKFSLPRPGGQPQTGFGGGKDRGDIPGPGDYGTGTQPMKGKGKVKFGKGPGKNARDREKMSHRGSRGEDDDDFDEA